MTFNSYIFILLFLPLVLTGYYCYFFSNRKKLINVFLLIASVIFYASAGWETGILLLVSTIFNFGLYCLLVDFSVQASYTKRKCILWLGIAVNLMVLAYFKYYNFFIDNLNMLFDTGLTIKKIILPLGISFITFQQIAFLVDSYRREVSSCSFIDYMLFVLFFPHVSSGPIILHGDFFPLLKAERKMNWDKFASGLFLFVMGLGKKVLIADMFGSAADWGYANIVSLNTTSAVFVSFAYTIQIYFDFSGYSDMAVGISRMLQLDLPINFNSPYKANTILEFWDRWHITLTRFFTKYLYIPLGGNRRGNMRTYINILIVFLCSGLWHGASWTFILWGGLHGCFMVLTRRFKKVFDKIPVFLNKCITLVFVNFAWILFRSNSFTVFKQMIKTIIRNDWGNLNDEICACFKPVVLENVNCPVWLYAAASLLIVGYILLKCKNAQEQAESIKYSVRSCAWVLAVAVLSILSLSGVNTFVYSLF